MSRLLLHSVGWNGLANVGQKRGGKIRRLSHLLPSTTLAPCQPSYPSHHPSYYTTTTTAHTTSAPSTSLCPTHMIQQLPVEFVRASDPALFGAQTFQRTSVSFDRITGKPSFASDPSHDTSRNIHIRDCHLEDNVCRVTWSNGQSSNYPTVWIRQSYQRWVSCSQLSTSTSTSQKSISQSTTFAPDQSPQNPDNPSISTSTNNDIVRWRDWTPASLYKHASMDCAQLLHDDQGMTKALHILYRFGILHLARTPTDDDGAAVAAIGAALGGGHVKENPLTSLYAQYNQTYHGDEEEDSRQNNRKSRPKAASNDSFRIQFPHGTDGPLRTLYGTVWSTTSGGQADGASVADSAYGHEGLPLHTDMTYLQNPPGLQVFTMVQPATASARDNGDGASIFADGWAAAALLRQSHPEAYQTLTSIPRRYRCVDPTTGWHLEATGPVLQTSPWDRTMVTAVRHNDLDRLPDLPPYLDGGIHSTTDFYQRLKDAHHAWDTILAEDSTRLVVPLKSGDTVVVANQVRPRVRSISLFPSNVCLSSLGSMRLTNPL